MVSIKPAMRLADSHMDENKRLIVATGHQIPAEFVQTYRKVLNKRSETPAKSFRLRRSVRYQAVGNQAIIRWLAPYAAAQEAGQANGRIFRNYTTSGTGRGFAQNALSETRQTFMKDFAANHPELGL